MKKFLVKKQIFFKKKLINTLIQDGKKKTGEKIVIKFAKVFQKLNDKKFDQLFQLSLINTTPIFFINTQIVKRGNKKITKDIPSFLKTDNQRIKSSLIFFKQSIGKEKKYSHMYKMLAKEVLISSTYTSSSVEKKVTLQKQMLLNKRYWSKFKW